MKTKYLIITLAAAVAVGGLVLYNARAVDHADHPGAYAHGGRILQHVAERLGLSDSQKTQIKAELKAEKDTLVKLLTQFHDARKGLHEAIQAKDATEASIRAAAAKVGAVQADLAVEHFKLYGKITPLLTDEQREKAAQLHEHMDDFATGIIERISEHLAE